MAMAPSEISSASSVLADASVSSSRAPTPSLRNPLPLSAAQEAQVRDLYYKRVRSKCAEEIKEFALCAKGRTVTTSWTCRAQRFAMNSCMIAHATRENEDAARVEWFNSVEARRQKRQTEFDEVEKRRLEVIEMTKRQEEKERILKEKEDSERIRSRDASTGADGSTKKRGWWG